MRRPIFVLTLVVWVAALGVLVYRTIPGRAPAPSSVPRGDLVTGETWMGVYHEDQKVGYSQHRLAAVGSGIEFSEASLLRMTMMETPQVVRTRIRGHADARYALQDFEFELTSGIANLSMTGIVRGGALSLTIRSGGDTTAQTIRLDGPIYLPSTLRAAMAGSPLAVGREMNVSVFDPVSMTNDRLHATVEAEEIVPGTVPAQQAWRLREEFHGIETRAWIDASGTVLREEGPMGFVLVRESPDDAVGRGWRAEGAALDLTRQVSIPVSAVIDDARTRRHLRVRLSGIDLARLPSDDEQRLAGDVLRIDRPDLATIASYRLPYTAGGAPATDLVATPFLQSDHPRIRAAAHAAVGDERDAKTVARRLNAWVTGHLRKAPTVSIPNAVQVLEMGEGDCNEHAVLFAALARAVGLPARVAAGAVYLDGAFLYHAWCEVWLGRWVSIDPALDQFPADATHLKLLSGGPETHFAFMGIIGRLGIEVLPDATLGK